MFERLVEIKFELTDGRGLGSTAKRANRLARDGFSIRVRDGDVPPYLLLPFDLARCLSASG
jgi:hypothetical protein